ncbi:hypothetical protein [Actinacidiphila rubida]|uniref:Uncharacterized protein n=1 Tax=Actinacidiphila rubida TaxID=310780 RepID=A0A1H8S587_9ACTN|nr:hypothetical protein [Actinacidiphila rubida]SEO73478.1 hypothetical protein SAMN05216267_103924 [Actinacidiphila rubida]
MAQFPPSQAALAAGTAKAMAPMMSLNSQSVRSDVPEPRAGLEGRDVFFRDGVVAETVPDQWTGRGAAAGAGLP